MNPKWVRLTRTHPHTIHAPAHTPHTHHSSHGGPRSPCGPKALPGFSSHPSLGSPFLPWHPLPRSLEKPLNHSPPALTLSELGVSRDLWPGGHTACQPTLFVFSINPVGPPFLRPHSQTTPSTALSRPVPGSEPTGSHSPGRTLSPAPARTCCGPCHPVHWAPATLPPPGTGRPPSQPLHRPSPLPGALGPGWPLRWCPGGHHCSPSPFPYPFTTNQPRASLMGPWWSVTHGAGGELSILFTALIPVLGTGQKLCKC